jgi:cell division protein FtsI/penicillin-binding protein 2
MADKLTTALPLGRDAVSATFEDSNGFFADVVISREDLAKLVRAIEGGSLRSRFSTFMEPDTTLKTAAGAYLLRNGYTRDTVIAMADWQRIWTAEASGWDRASVETVNF